MNEKTEFALERNECRWSRVQLQAAFQQFTKERHADSIAESFVFDWLKSHKDMALYCTEIPLIDDNKNYLLTKWGIIKFFSDARDFEQGMYTSTSRLK